MHSRIRSKIFLFAFAILWLFYWRYTSWGTIVEDLGAVDWASGVAPRTEILAHYAGWTIFEQVYMSNGTIFIVSSDSPKSLPERRMMISAGLGLGEVEANEPTDKQLRVVTPAEASILFGGAAIRMTGVTFMSNDPPQFLDHLFHWMEVIGRGMWRVYSSLDPGITEDGSTSLSWPNRMLFPHCDSKGWQDRAGFNTFFLSAVFPSMELYFSDDVAAMASGPTPLLFDRLVFGDRAAWHRWNNIADPNTPYPLNISSHWWAPVRRTIVEFSAGSERQVTWGVARDDRPLITYVARQKTGRRLKQSHHESLVRELESLAKRNGYEFVVANFEDLAKVDQVYLCSRTTIMIGVHGNGLTNALWMKPNPRSALIEIFVPGGFALDYEYTARSTGLAYFAFWESKHFSSKDLPPVNIFDGFHSAAIPVDGKAVAKVIHEQLSRPL